MCVEVFVMVIIVFNRFLNTYCLLLLKFEHFKLKLKSQP